MLKLIKHELKATWKLVCATLGSYLAMAVILWAGLYVAPEAIGLRNYCAIITVLSFVTGAVVLHGYFINRFRVTVFGKEGYITNTLPVNIRQIIISKWLVAVCQSVIALGIMVLAGYVIFRQYDAGEIIFEIFYMGYSPLFKVAAILRLIASVISFYITVFAVMAVGHSFESSKILISIGAYFGFTYVRGFIETVFTYFNMFMFMDNLYECGGLSITGMYAGYVITDVICTVAAYFIAHYFMKNKLALE